MSTPTRNIRLPVAVGAALARCVPAGLVGFALLAGGAAQAQSPGIALATRSTLAQAGQPATLSPATQAPAPAPQLWPADKVERRPVAELEPYARNARTHGEAQVAQIAASIK